MQTSRYTSRDYQSGLRRIPRVVRDIARSLKKEINLVMHGEDTGS